MKLLQFAFVKVFRRLKNVGFNFTPNIRFHYDPSSHRLSMSEEDNVPVGFFGEKVFSVTAIFFRIKDKSALTDPRAYDTMEIEIDTGTDIQAKKLIDDLRLEQRYGRHREIVMQLECAKYVERYYRDLEAELTAGMGIAGDAVRRKESGVICEVSARNPR